MRQTFSSGGVMFFVSALAFLSVAIDASADRMVGGWNIHSGDHQCAMITEFEGDTVLSLSTDWRNNDVGVQIWNPKWKSLAQRDGQKIKIEFILSGDLPEYDQWWNDTAIVVTLADEDVYGVWSTWDGEEHAKDFWPAWALANGVQVKIDGKIVGRYTLSGSRAASLALVACAAKGLRDDKSDPFAK